MKIDAHLEKMTKTLLRGYNYVEYRGHHPVAPLVAAHHLPPQTFTGPAVVRHKNKTRTDDRAENLEWASWETEVEEVTADGEPIGDPYASMRAASRASCDHLESGFTVTALAKAFTRAEEHGEKLVMVKGRRYRKVGDE